MIRVAKEQGDIVIRFNEDAVDTDGLLRILDLLNHEIQRPNSVNVMVVRPFPKRSRKRSKAEILESQLELPL